MYFSAHWDKVPGGKTARTHFEGALVSFLLSHINRGNFQPWIFTIIIVNVTYVICLSGVLLAFGTTRCMKGFGVWRKVTKLYGRGRLLWYQ